MGFIPVTFVDIIDIVVVATLMYYIYKITRSTHAPSIITGILVIYLLWIVVRALNMELLSAILGQLIGVGVVALIVVFQPEIRRFLQHIGVNSRRRRDSFFGRLLDFREVKSSDLEYLTPIVKACTDMAASKTGALIVLQQRTDLSLIADTGIGVDASITASLLKNIFFKNSPLHDGAVIINNGRIVAAKCILPSTDRGVPISFGMRHRAALGVTEVTDAIVIVVSEETGAVSLAQHGQIKCGIPLVSLREEIEQHILENPEVETVNQGLS